LPGFMPPPPVPANWPGRIPNATGAMSPRENPPASLGEARSALRKAADEAYVPGMQRFFKTGPGEYAEGDRFIGVRMPAVRKVARSYRGLPLADVEELLQSPVHEERMLALVLMVEQFRRADSSGQTAIYELYLSRTDVINNWDLIDISAPHVVGAYLVDRPRDVLFLLAGSDSLWERRIAILSTFAFIRRNEFADTLRIAERLVEDEHDLIHKAVGWMLREVGNRDRDAEEAFLRAHARVMPRTMLRYAIEKFPEGLRREYLSGTFD